MSDASEILSRRKSSGPPTLTGSDIKGMSVKITVVSAEESPTEWTAPIKVTFKPPVKSTDKTRGEINTIGLNKTNCKALIERFGPDTDKWKGKSFVLGKLTVNNPKTNNPTFGLRVMG